MASEITQSYSLSFFKAAAMIQSVSRSLSSHSIDWSGTKWIHHIASVATSATALGLGNVTTPHWAFFYNLDTSNYLTIRNGSSGADVLELRPGQSFVCSLYRSIVPYAVANTAACLLEYLILDA